MSAYLTTELQTQNPYFLNAAANVMLTPVRYLFGARALFIIDKEVLVAELPEPKRSLLKTAAMVAALVPGVLFGVIARALSYAIEEVRTAFALMQNPPRPPAPRPMQEPSPDVNMSYLPIESVVDKDITFFRELLKVPDGELKAWLESKKSDKSYIDPFHGASVLAESKIEFEGIDSKHMTELFELFGKALERLQKLEASQSATISIAAVSASTPAKPKEPNPPSQHILSMFKKIRPPVLTDLQFAEMCQKYHQDPNVVLAAIKESEQRVRIQKLADLVIVFYLDLSDVEDKNVAQWLKAKRADKNYLYPFTIGADSLKKPDYYKNILGGTALRDLQEKHKEAALRLAKLNLIAFLKEK